MRNDSKGIAHYMSPKVWLGQLGLTIYFSGSVPLNVGLYKDHDFCPVPGYREVHTQLVGFLVKCSNVEIGTYKPFILKSQWHLEPLIDQCMMSKVVIHGINLKQ